MLSSISIKPPSLLEAQKGGKKEGEKAGKEEGKRREGGRKQE